MLKLGFVLAWLVSGSALAGSHKMAPKVAKAHTYDVAFISEMVGDKKTWVMVPSNAKFKKGKKVTAKVVNVLEASHGFEIPGVAKPMVINPHTSTMVQFVPNKAGKQDVKCHMHPAHVGTSFEVK